MKPRTSIGVSERMSFVNSVLNPWGLRDFWYLTSLGTFLRRPRVLSRTKTKVPSRGRTLRWPNVRVRRLKLIRGVQTEVLGLKIHELDGHRKYWLRLLFSLDLKFQKCLSLVKITRTRKRYRMVRLVYQLTHGMAWAGTLTD